MGRGEDVREILALIDRLESLLERSALSELELEVGGTTLVLRTPSALAPAGHAPAGSGYAPAVAGHPAASVRLDPADPATAIEAGPEERRAHAVTAPLTGVFYRSPIPGAEPYVREGGPVSSGQVIGLIEAMKLFNEIKSDISGIVRTIAAGDGELVKARQTLIEVDPA